MIKRSSPPPGLRPVAILAAALVALAATACTDNDPTPTAGGGTPTATASAVGTDSATEPASTTPAGNLTPTATDGATETATADLTATPDDETDEEPSAEALLSRNLVSSLTTGLTPDETREALEDIEVVTVTLAIEEREVWIAATSGSGIYSLPESREHVAAAYEIVDGSWVELAHMALASAPTFAELEVVAEWHEGSAWIAVHGLTGAHSGTFELLQFDGFGLYSNLWWFSSMPGAATVVDLDAAAPPEIVLNATDPYVYCYACGVRAWDEVIYRWMDGQLVEVPLAGVTSGDQLVTDLTEFAALYAQADLWRRALDAANEALALEPENEDVWWLHALISRVADSRLEHAGAEQQPFMTNVLAGEYEAAVDLMRPYLPATALAPDGPLVEGTVAEEGWDDATATWVLDYTERALAVAPDLAAAHAVRAFGLLAENPEDWSGALQAMETALQLEPQDDFYREAVQYLLAQSGNGAG